MSFPAGQMAELAHGYTLNDVDRLAKQCLGGYVRSLLALDSDERHNVAFYAIVETIYTSYARPTRYELVDVGMSAIRTAINEQFRHHGRNSTNPGEERPSFEAYWLQQGGEPSVGGRGRRTAWSDGFSDRLLERMALPAALKVLDVDEYEAIVALAANGSSRAAARALDVSVNALNTRLKSGRRKATEAWFEPDTPRALVQRVTGDVNACARGHSRAEHGRQDARGYWLCRECQRKAQAQWAREHRAEQLRLAEPEQDVPVKLTFAPAPEGDPVGARYTSGLNEHEVVIGSTACWCGLNAGHDWPHKESGAAHPRVA